MRTIFRAHVEVLVKKEGTHARMIGVNGRSSNGGSSTLLEEYLAVDAANLTSCFSARSKILELQNRRWIDKRDSTRLSK